MPEPSVLRLDRYLSQAADLSRSQARRAIRDGAVRVDGAAVRDPSAQVPPAAEVCIGTRQVVPPGHRYLMLHKPAGVVCTRGDGHHRSVFDLVDATRAQTLHVAGRLDADATGLVLLTDDGGWSHRVTAPRRKLAKVYLVTLAAPLDDAALESLRSGVVLRGDSRPTRPALAERLDHGRIRLTIGEGRYHQVKRMFAAVGNRVVGLHREAVGELVLDRSLGPGGYRELDAAEVAALGGGGDR